MPNTSLTDKSTVDGPDGPLVTDLYPYDGLPTRYEWRLHNTSTNLRGEPRHHVEGTFTNPGDAKQYLPFPDSDLTWLGSPDLGYRCYLVGSPQPDLNHQPGSPVDRDPWGLQIDLNNPPEHLLIYTLTRHPLSP